MAWKLLFSSDFGLLSLFVILFVIGMAFYIYRMATRKMAEDEIASGKPTKLSGT